MGLQAAIAGASGYAGGELARLLLTHPELDPTVLTAGAQAGRRVGAVHPQLTPLADRVLAATDADALGSADVVFLALPHGESANLVAALRDDVVVVDLGADFRLHDADAWRTYYSGQHAGTWTYGLPELPGQRAAIRSSRRIANPGCYATAVALGLAPVLAAGLVEPADVVVVAASGTSGAGRGNSPTLGASEVMGSMSPYGVGGGHRHTPEITQNLSAAAGTPVSLSFTPTLAPMSRGILATCTARLAAGVDPAAVRAAYAAAYHDEPFVHLLPSGQWPRTADVLGSNSVQLQVVVDEDAGRVVVVAAVDNLTKGTAGAAVQCANLALGLPETTGLPVAGVAP